MKGDEEKMARVNTPPDKWANIGSTRSGAKSSGSRSQGPQTNQSKSSGEVKGSKAPKK